MCSETRLRRLPLAAVAALALAAGACGLKEPPQPPPSKIPAPTVDLSVQQRGREILLGMTYPSTTMGGLALPEIEGIEVWQLVRFLPALGAAPAAPAGEDTEPADEEAETAAETAPAAEEAPTEDEPQPPAPPAGAPLFRLPTPATEGEAAGRREDEIPVDPGEFAGTATLRLTVRGPELEASVTGDRLLLRLPIEAAPAGEPAAPAEPAAEAPAQRAAEPGAAPAAGEERLLALAVKTLAGGRTSPFSNLVKIIPRQAPAPPTELAVEAVAAGVKLTWTRPDETAAAFRVYRRDAQSRDYGAPLAEATPESAFYLDTTAVFGSRYIYTVTTLGSRLPVVESAVAAEHEVDYKDRFPPPAPQGLVALGEPGRVRLLWEPPVAADLAGYLVFRRPPGGEFAPLTAEPVTALEYLDGTVVTGRTYGYQVVAVDDSGNRGSPSQEIEVRVP